MDSLLARFAEDSYWMARYVERAESLARILDVTETFGRGRDNGADWVSVLKLFGDVEAFGKRYQVVDAKNVIRFYTIDQASPNSIVSSLRLARNNARTLRHLISVEMWTKINVLYNRVSDTKTRDVSVTKLSGFCASVKDDCQLFLGSTHNTLFRDQVWYFYRMGRFIERCDQTTRLVDIKTRSAASRKASVAEGIDMSEWNSLLRAAGTYHGYLRRHPREMTQQTVSSFVLFDPAFPGSLTFCVREIAAVLEDMRAFLGEKALNQLKRQIKRIERLAKTTSETELDQGLQEFVDSVQLELIKLHNGFARHFFPALAPAA
ncbi:MAG: alpha-E domain-containing protein [Burkholderiaceae bacterium]